MPSRLGNPSGPLPLDGDTNIGRSKYNHFEKPWALFVWHNLHFVYQCQRYQCRKNACWCRHQGGRGWLTNIPMPGGPPKEGYGLPKGPGPPKACPLPLAALAPCSSFLFTKTDPLGRKLRTSMNGRRACMGYDEIRCNRVGQLFQIAIKHVMHLRRNASSGFRDEGGGFKPESVRET